MRYSEKNKYFKTFSITNMKNKGAVIDVNLFTKNFPQQDL